MNKVLFLLICLVMCIDLHAQVVTYENAKKKAQKSFDNAQLAVQEYKLEDAIALLQDAIKTEPGFTDAYGQMVITSVEMRKYKEAINSYEVLVRLDSASTRPAMLAYCKALSGVGRFKEALDLVNLYIATNKTKSAKAEGLKANLNFAVNTAQQAVPFQPHNLGDSINSKDPEYFPSLTIDNKTLIFTRRVNGKNEDFYVSEKDDSSKWGPAVSIGQPVNSSSFNEGAQNVSQDGKMLVFTGCDFPGGRGSCDIYYTIKTQEGLWIDPVNMGAPINSRDWESQPCLSADKQTLYFARETPGSGSDIYTSQLQPNGKWGMPERLGPNINTTGRETTPFIHADNQTLYFASNGLQGYGGMDIFYSRRQADGSWGPATNLGYPINTIDEEASLVVASDGKTAYYASDRADSRGELDIYSFELYPAARPLKTLFVRGFVHDAKNINRRLIATLDLTDLETGYNIATIKSDEYGNYLVTLPVGKDYAFNVNKKGFLFHSENFSLKNSTDQDSSFEQNIPLTAIDTGAVLILHNIVFDSKQYNLKPASYYELEKVVALMKENPTMTTEIGGHTDNVGSGYDNMILSENRAKAVLNYLVSKGISADRLEAKGYGESKPVGPNTTEAGRALNRRTEFKILCLE
ncbi:WD40-like Beta Propeller Repeat [Chitinophaga sp. CF118]|uniref:OmpA family protein n=1 Tax=Chitinophaga sp. CF118 TaxID=1884367 RepID=UPI0008E5123D|nr:OmpA family protein [Chitinophaga sp. CF118]SFD12127.1 WD40-like Beta Propeller Repeat [Chitinophaga sp. CF118]